MRFKVRLLVLILPLVLIFSIIVGLAFGPVHIPLSEVFSVMGHKLTFWAAFPSGIDDTILWQVRLPRVLTGVLVGICLATAGVVFQALFRNPMADPYIIGVSAGAGLGATLAIYINLRFFLLGFSSVPLLAFCTGIATVFLVYNLARRGEVVAVETLLLAGIAVSAFLSAIVSLIIIMSRELIQTVTAWLLGALSGSDWGSVQMVFPYALIGFAVIFAFAKDLNILLLGEEAAMQLGIEVERLKRLLLVFGALVTAAAVSVSGLIGFVGLVVPHIVRIMVGPDHRRLLPAAALTGGIIMAWADLFSRWVVAPLEVPIGVVTAILGAPFFIYLLRISRRKVF